MKIINNIAQHVMRNTTLLLCMCLLGTSITVAADNFITTAQGAQYKDLKTGEGASADIGDVATIHFIGWLDNKGNKGKEFYNTRKQQRPVSFVIGTDKVMPGWNEGIIGMQAGGKRLLKLPPELGYGNKGVQKAVPANARLIIMIELVGLEK